jgi:hypothetical protein
MLKAIAAAPAIVPSLVEASGICVVPEEPAPRLPAWALPQPVSALPCCFTPSASPLSVAPFEPAAALERERNWPWSSAAIAPPVLVRPRRMRTAAESSVMASAKEAPIAVLPPAASPPPFVS